MHDPRLGAFGGVGLILFLLLKVSAVMAVPPVFSTRGPLIALLLAPTLGRWLILLAARRPMARPGGLGAEFRLGINWRSYLYAGLAPVGLLALGGLRAFLAVGLAHLVMWAIVRLAHNRLGGLSGDILGLIVELGELSVLIVYAVR